MVGLIGYTGTVGAHIAEQYNIDKFYNSKNIDSIIGEHFDILFISAISAAKYIANQDGVADKRKICSLLDTIKHTSADKVIFISTIDVHNNDYYGQNRLFAEQEISKMFENAHIIRLPGLVGKHIKKNFIYDICHDKDLSYTSINSKYEFMNLEDLHVFIDKALNENIKLLEIRSEPVSTVEICNALSIDHALLNKAPGVIYTHEDKNQYTKFQELEFIKEYVEKIGITN